ncbi:hypothetical protein TNCV_476551 [Trichonephila clavipes]|nr:hypothetical protein TNCV_476551 [Trichonephila clavipes]
MMGLQIHQDSNSRLKETKFASIGSGGLVVACPLRKPKVVGPTPSGGDRFSGCENLPTDDVFSRLFIESSTLEQVLAIRSGMAIDWAGFVSSHARPVEVYFQKVMSGS